MNEKIKTVFIKLLLNEKSCTQLHSCQKFQSRWDRLAKDRYINNGSPGGWIIVAWIDLQGLDYVAYSKQAGKSGKGNTRRSVNTASREGFYCKQFVKSNFIPDVVAINTSKKVRSGGLMKSGYLKSVEELGGAPIKFTELEVVGCPLHWDVAWGVFRKQPGYKQGDLVVNEQLVAYTTLRRLGDLIHINTILGHGEFLKYGIMFSLHFAIMKWFCSEEKEVQEVKGLMYAGFGNEGTSLRFWKEKLLFEPVYLKEVVS